MTGYDYIAQILKQEGIEWLACFPSNPVIEAVAEVGIRPVMFRHERGAVMAADGYSRTSARRRFGVVAVQSQAGAENALGGLAQAAADNVPLLFLPGGNTLANMMVRPNFSALRSYQGVAKTVEPILRADQVAAVMRRAFNALRNGPPGPVVVELLGDVCAEQVPSDAQSYRSPAPAPQRPDAAAVSAAATALRGARRPLIWAGAGVLSAAATAELAQLAELTATPVFCTMPGKSAIPDAHPLALGAGSRATTLAAHRWLDQCDVLLAVGTSLTNSPYGQSVAAGKTVIHNTVDPADLNKDTAADIGLLGDARLTLQALIDELADRPAEPSKLAAVTEEVATVRNQWQAAWAPVLRADDQPLSYYRVVHALNEVLDNEASIVTHDAGAPRDCMVPFRVATVPHSYIGWGKTTHLGFGIPLVIGAKMAHPDRFCVNVMGDAAFGMSGMDLETAARAEVPITTVLLNNGDMATYSGAGAGQVGPHAREFGVTHTQGEYAQLAEALGATGIVVRTAAELHQALGEAQRLNGGGRTVLIEVFANVESRRSVAGSDFMP